METLKTALALVKSNFFSYFLLFFSFCSLDLKDAYFSVHVNESSQEYLKFFWGSALHVHSFSQWVSMLPKIIHKIVETSDGPSSYGPSSYGPSVFTDDTRLQLERKGRILSTASSLLTGSSSNVRELAQFVGQVVSCFQGVKFGPLWYRYMENDKIIIIIM